MYQTSLAQFLELFMDSMDKSEKATLASKRVENIIYTMTYLVYRYINRGLYEADKLTFVLIVTLKILVTAKRLNQGDVNLLSAEVQPLTSTVSEKSRSNGCRTKHG